MVDSSAKFWERLIVDAIGVVVVGFVLQGLWFAAGSAITGWRPELEPAYQKVSERFLALWVLGLLIGLGWGVKRAWAAGRD